jgi:glutamate racemase
MAIGVFDSGVGGLTVHRELVARFPERDFVYFADQARGAIGGKTGEEIVELTREGCTTLFDAGPAWSSWPATPPRPWPCAGCSRPGSRG